MLRHALMITLSLLFLTPAYAQETPPTQEDKPAPEKKTTLSKTGTEGQGSPGAKAPATATPPKELSEAERITRLERTIAEGKKRLAELNTKLDKQKNDPESEFSQAQKEFEKLDQQLKEAREKLPTLEGEQAKEAQTALDNLTKQWQLARDRFDLAIQDRKAIEEQKAAQELALQQDTAALEKLLAPPATQPAPTTQAPQGNEPAPSTSPETPAPAPAPAPAVGTPAAPAAPPTEATPAAAETKTPTKEEIKATEDLKEKEVQAQQAEEEVKSLDDRIASLSKSIDAQAKQVETAKKRVDVARQTETVLKEQLQQLDSNGGSDAEKRELRAKIEDARQRFRKAQQEASDLADGLNALRAQMSDLQEEKIAALAKAEQARMEEEQAKEDLAKIQNPFSIQNMTLWITTHGPSLLAIVIGVFIALWLVRFADKRIVVILAGKSDIGSRIERENRAKTIVGVFHNFSTLAIYAGGLIMILDEIGIPIAPLMGGVAVFGLAIAFGAQNLVRDYFYGIMILLENQYGINDVVKIAGIGGLVEKVTLRVTVLRDLEGIAHFIPNGEIKTVSNMTHGWSRALFDIGVAYKEDVDQVMQLLVELGKEMRKESKYSGLILDDPEMLGVDAFADSAIVIKFFIKTKPLQQWTVKREMLRRIKKRFDELRIEIPFPHRTVYHRTEDDFKPRVYFEQDTPARIGNGDGNEG